MRWKRQAGTVVVILAIAGSAAAVLVTASPEQDVAAVLRLVMLEHAAKFGTSFEHIDGRPARIGVVERLFEYVTDARGYSDIIDHGPVPSALSTLLAGDSLRITVAVDDQPRTCAGGPQSRDRTLCFLRDFDAVFAFSLPKFEGKRRALVHVMGEQNTKEARTPLAIQIVLYALERRHGSWRILGSKLLMAS